ncbi:MAG: Panacea domain-containing protein [Beijerinckiaceae bacterium]
MHHQDAARYGYDDDLRAEMQFDRTKLKEVILYACSHCEPAKLGAVKLNKVLYFADMLHYANVGAPITGSTYRKRPMGPTCDQLPGTLDELERTGELQIRDVDYFGFRKKEYIASAIEQGETLSKLQRELLNEVIEFVCVNNSAKTISEFSHNKAWEIAEFGAEIKYNSVFNLFPTQVSPDTWEWAAQEAQSVEAARSGNNPVATRTFGDFRKRVLAGLRN